MMKLLSLDCLLCNLSLDKNTFVLDWYKTFSNRFQFKLNSIACNDKPLMKSRMLGYVWSILLLGS